MRSSQCIELFGGEHYFKVIFHVNDRSVRNGFSREYAVTDMVADKAQFGIRVNHDRQPLPVLRVVHGLSDRPHTRKKAGPRARLVT